METYRELKARQEKEVHALPFGFAFSETQFEEMKIKLGVKENCSASFRSGGSWSPTAKRLTFKEMSQNGSFGIKPYQPDVYEQTTQQPGHRNRRITVTKVTSYTAKDRKQLHHQQHSGLQKATFCHSA